MSRRRKLLFGICVLQLVGLLVLLALGGGDGPAPAVAPDDPESAPLRPAPVRLRESGRGPDRPATDAAANGFAGRLLLPADVPPDRLEVVIRGEPAFGAPAARFAGAAADDVPDFEPVPIEAAVVPASTGDFVVEGLSAGIATVLVRILGEDEPVFAADGVAITEGGSTPDQRIATIDLRRVVRAITVVVNDAGGSPVSGAHVIRSGPAEAPAVPLRADLNGRCLLVTALPALDLEVRHPDHRPARVTAVSGPREIHLQRRLRVRLELGAGSTLPAGCARLTARLVPVDPEARTVRQDFDAGGAAVLDVEVPGRYRVEIDAAVGGGVADASMTLVIRPRPQEIDVLDSAEVSTWVVGFGPR